MSQQDQLYTTIINDLETGKLVLPTLPEVALKVREIANDPEVSVQQLAEVISTDTALSARLIKISNSPLYRGRSEVESVQTAVSRLGIPQVRNLVTGLVMEQLFLPPSKRLENRMRALWQHSIEVAAACQLIASSQTTISTDEALLAGLIHEIGSLPILMKVAAMPELIEDEQHLDRLIEDLCPQIGEAILRKWAFPENLITVAAEHTNLQRDSLNGPDLTDVVQVAKLQSYFNTDKALPPNERDKVLAFAKLGVDTGISVVELDENSEEYAAALALFQNN